MGRLTNILGFFILCVTNGLFAFFVMDFSLNIPFYDDFDSIGTFILSGNNAFGSRLFHVFDQYAEHRIGYTRMISLLYFSLFGKLNFMHLIWFGLLGLLGIQVLIYSVVQKFRYAFVALSICSLFLLNFQYWENMMSAMTALQNISSPFFSLAALYFLSKGSLKWNRLITYLIVVLTVFTSGNGVLLLPIGFIFILFSKEGNRQLYLWLLFAFGLLLIYFLNYQKPPAVFGGRSNIGDMLLSPVSLFENFTLFLTSVFHGIGFSFVSCFVIGTLIVGYMTWFIYQVVFVLKMKHAAMNWYFLVFIFLLGTAFLVALNRGGGLENMLFSRYKIYSSLVLVFVFLSALEFGKPKAITGVFFILAVCFSYQSLPFVSTLYNHFNELKYAGKTYELNNRNWKGIYPPFTTNFTNAENASRVCQMLISKGYYQGDWGFRNSEKQILGKDSIQAVCASFTQKSLTYHTAIDMAVAPIPIDEFNCIQMQSSKNMVLLPLKVNLSAKDLLKRVMGMPIYASSFTVIVPKSNVDHGNYSLSFIQTKNGILTKCKMMDLQVPYFETPQFHN